MGLFDFFKKDAKKHSGADQQPAEKNEELTKESAQTDVSDKTDAPEVMPDNADSDAQEQNFTVEEPVTEAAEESESETETGTGTESETETETEAEAETETELQAVQETETETETETESEAEALVQTEVPPSENDAKEPKSEEKKHGFFERLKEGLRKTKQSVFGQINDIFKSFVKVDEDMLEELEETLIASDIGINITEEIIEKLRDRIKEKRISEPSDAKNELIDILTQTIGENEGLKLDTKPSVILVIGVNGVGKTTSIAKLAKSLKDSGKSVVLAAADTFRAAAIDQLEIWADRVGVPIVKHTEGADPAAVVFDACSYAKSHGSDVLIIDTAGRLHIKKNLMDELAKISRVIDRELSGVSRESLLVLDAVTGQNAINQAKEFTHAADITGIILTKLDGTAKGGVIISVKKELGIPVKFIGVGEGMDDLQKFDREAFVKALFED